MQHWDLNQTQDHLHQKASHDVQREAVLVLKRQNSVMQSESLEVADCWCMRFRPLFLYHILGRHG